MKRLSRRKVVTGCAALGAAIVGCGKPEDSPAAAAPEAWDYQPLSAEAVAADAFRQMPEGGCMHAVAASILAAWSKAAGRSIDGFPLHLFQYGEGGIAGWGSICGALNGGAAMIGLFERDKKRRAEAIARLFTWYERTPLPECDPPDRQPRPVASKAESVLCHVSVGRWRRAADAKLQSPEMRRRCRCLVAEVAAKTVLLLNGDGTAPPSVLRETTDAAHVMGKMQCGTCHANEAKKL